MRILPAGAQALMVDLIDPTDATPRAWLYELLRRREAGEIDVTEIVPGASTVLLDGLADPPATAAQLASWRPELPAASSAGPAGPAVPVVSIPVIFDGEDLAGVATRWGTDGTGVAQRLRATPLEVAFCGFAPGFAYLTGMPRELAVPRRATPRTRVPAGSVALADSYVGIYPNASPGGWLLVGRTSTVLFDPSRTPPALLTPGCRVRLVEPA